MLATEVQNIKDNFQVVSGLEEFNFFGALFPVEY